MNLKVRKFLSYYKPYKRLLVLDLICALIVASISLAIPLLTRYLINEGLNNVYSISLIMLMLVIIQSYCNYFVAYYGHVMGAKMETDMRNELFSHYQKLSFNFFDHQKTGELMTRITNDTLSMTELFHHGPEDIIISIINFIGVFIVLFIINFELACIVLLFMVIILFYSLYFNKKMIIALSNEKKSIGNINAELEDSISGIRIIKSFTNEDLEKNKFNIRNMNFLKLRKNTYKNEAYYYEGVWGLSQLLNLVIIIIAAISIANNKMNLADLVAFLMYVGILLDPIKRLINFTRLYQEGVAGFNRFIEMLNVEVDIKDKQNAIDLTDCKGSISFKEVSFKYQDNIDYTLENICFDITPGEFIAIVGSSGIGKTTLSSLIPRFYDVDKGSVSIDNQNIKNLTLKSLRKNIGIVQQDVFLFNGTIFENIAYGNPGATKEMVIEAAKKANAHDFIVELKDDYNTTVGQRGVLLSGGQKQRISIARMFLKNPPIIILDEATSSLDNESEKIIKETLMELSKNRTTIVIAHRLSTIDKADRIIVLDNKTIAEIGTHDQLLKLKGIYYNLYNI